MQAPGSPRTRSIQRVRLHTETAATLCRTSPAVQGQTRVNMCSLDLTRVDFQRNNLQSDNHAFKEALCRKLNNEKDKILNRKKKDFVLCPRSGFASHMAMAGVFVRFEAPPTPLSRQARCVAWGPPVSAMCRHWTDELWVFGRSISSFSKGPRTSSGTIYRLLVISSSCFAGRGRRSRRDHHEPGRAKEEEKMRREDGGTTKS